MDMLAVVVWLIGWPMSKIWIKDNQGGRNIKYEGIVSLTIYVVVFILLYQKI